MHFFLKIFIFLFSSPPFNIEIGLLYSFSALKMSDLEVHIEQSVKQDEKNSQNISRLSTTLQETSTN